MALSSTAVSDLLHAAFRGDVQRLSALLDQQAASGLTVNSTDYDKRSALHLAASENMLECVKFLVNRGATVNAKDRWNGTPLDDAIRHRHDTVVSFLLERGGKTGDDREALQRLFTAVEKGKVQAVKTCIAAGSDVNATDYDRRTPLHVAVASGQVEIIKVLRKAGANINAEDNFGLTPLAESHRHGVRTGENKIRDLLVKLGAKESKTRDETKSHKESHTFFVFVTAAQLLFTILFLTCTKFSNTTEDEKESTEAIRKYYGMFQDVHVMIFIGFGFLMTFLRKYGYSSVGLNFLVAAFVIQWHMLIGGFVEQAFKVLDGTQDGFEKIAINLETLLLADFASAAVLITFGAILGKVSATQLCLLGFLEIIFYAINENLLLKIGVLDIGGSIVVHVFGAYFGLAASWVLSKNSWKDDPQNAAVYHSDMFAMIGTIFLFVFWPSFVSAPAVERDQERCLIATLLSLVGSCVTAFVVSNRMRGGEFCMVDVQNATLAGGVAIGTAANLLVKSPGLALVVGIAAGLLSVVGYTVIQPKLQQAIGLHDTCGVNNLHGMPGILAAIVSAIACATASGTSPFPLNADQMAAYEVTINIGTEGGRTPGQQAGYQILCLVVCFLFASISGLACAAVVRFVDSLGETEAFVDSVLWEVPELEIPFYYDHRGEINRDILLDETHKTSLPIEIEEAESSWSDASDEEDLLGNTEG